MFAEVLIKRGRLDRACIVERFEDVHSGSCPDSCYWNWASGLPQRVQRQVVSRKISAYWIENISQVVPITILEEIVYTIGKMGISSQERALDSVIRRLNSPNVTIVNNLSICSEKNLKEIDPDLYQKLSGEKRFDYTDMSLFMLVRFYQKLGREVKMVSFDEDMNTAAYNYRLPYLDMRIPKDVRVITDFYRNRKPKQRDIKTKYILC